MPETESGAEHLLPTTLLLLSFAEILTIHLTNSHSVRGIVGRAGVKGCVQGLTGVPT